MEMEDDLQDIELGVWVDHGTKNKRWTVVREAKSMGKKMSSEMYEVKSGFFVNVADVMDSLCAVCVL